MSAHQALHEDREVSSFTPTIRPVSLGEPHWEGDGSLIAGVLASLPDADAPLSEALHWCTRVGRDAPAPGSGDTVRLWELLASVAAYDLSLARLLEPHLDALAILRQAGITDADQLAAIGADAASTWGVFAAEGPGVRVTATPDSAGGFVLDGVKPWCSVAGALSNALVTAHTGNGSRRLFAVDLRQAGVDAATGPWVARGLPGIVSAPVTFTAVRAVPIGDDGWYLQRPGFAWGGVGVAACWWGGTVGLARTLYAAAVNPAAASLDQIGQAHLGAVDLAVEGARSTLLEASRHVDGVAGDAAPPGIVAKRTRSIVASNAEAVLAHVAHALGPLPLVTDEAHAGRVADLQLYLRQHHAERDEAALGRALLETGVAPW